MKQADGLITSIYDKELGRELLNAPANDLRCTSGDRYRRYGYLAFPFDVPGGTFYAQLNGPVMRPYLDLTGHTGDAYVGARDWVGVENGEFGVALVQFDSMLVEFGEIHPDKTCYTGKPPAGNSAIFPALFNDWLVEHKPDGESFKYTGLITASKAIHGERLGQLCLEWGLDPSPDFDHWELCRGETADFPCDAAHFVAKVRPEVVKGLAFAVNRYDDRGLKTHTRYHYAIRTVRKNGEKGRFLTFSGLTRARPKGVITRERQ